jgi:hypothetical protein
MCTTLDERRRRNASSPFGRLPPEVIVHILTAAVTYPPTKTSQTPEYDSRWSRAMLLCAHVRAVALRTPSLWAFIDSRWSLPWIELCLGRAESTPLFLSAHATSPVRVLSDLLNRCSALFIDAGGQNDVNGFVSQCPPLQLDVVLNAGGNLSELRTFEFHGVSHSPFHLTSSFLGGSCQSLNSLVLHGVDIRNTPSFLSLRYLELKWIHTDRQLSSLRRMLEGAPLLETLSISYLFARDAHSYSSRDVNLDEEKRVDLHLLRALRITGTFMGVSILLRLLRVLPNPLDELDFSVENYDSTALGPSFQQRMDDIYTRISHLWAGKTGTSLAPMSELRIPPSCGRTLRLTSKIMTSPDGRLSNAAFTAQYTSSYHSFSSPVETIYHQSWPADA